MDPTQIQIVYTPNQAWHKHVKLHPCQDIYIHDEWLSFFSFNFEVCCILLHMVSSDFRKQEGSANLVGALIHQLATNLRFIYGFLLPKYIYDFLPVPHVTIFIHHSIFIFLNLVGPT